MIIVNVMASSLDGRIGAHDQEGDQERQNLGLSGAADQKFLRRQIEQADAIIVGASSIRANGECLDHKGRDGRCPSWFVFAQRPLPDHYHFWRQTHIPRFIVSPSAVPIVPGSGVINLVTDEQNPAKFLTTKLKDSRIQQALLFGGGVVNQWFYAAGLVDELCLTLAPVLLGNAHAPFLVAPELPQPVNFSLLASQVEESFVFLRYKVRHPC